MTPEPLAHLDRTGRPHLRRDHLQEVGGLAESFAARFGAGPWGRLAGRWHDLGKYAANFHEMIRRENGYAAHLEADPSAPRDHSSAGAIHALKLLGQPALTLAYAIAGHHAGLADAQELKSRLLLKAKCLDWTLEAKPPVDLLAGALPALPARFVGTSDASMSCRFELWTRFLFSALCDADFLDTERFLRPGTTPSAVEGDRRTNWRRPCGDSSIASRAAPPRPR